MEVTAFGDAASSSVSSIDVFFLPFFDVDFAADGAGTLPANWFLVVAGILEATNLGLKNWRDREFRQAFGLASPRSALVPELEARTSEKCLSRPLKQGGITSIWA